MGLFPWEDVFYHISSRSASLRAKYNEYQGVRDEIISLGAKQSKRVDDLRVLITNNFSLLIVAAIADLDQADYKDFITKNDEAQPEGASGYAALPWVEGTIELLGIADAGVFLVLSFRAIRAARAGSSIASVSEEAGVEMADVAGDVGMASAEAGTEAVLEGGGEAVAEAIAEASAEAAAEASAEAAAEVSGEAVAEAVAEGAAVSSGALAATGIGIVIAVGLDAIIGAINGAKEDEELDKQEENLRQALETVNKFYSELKKSVTSIESKIVTQQKEFIKNVEALNRIQPATFDFRKDPSLDNTHFFKTVSTQAVTQYGYLSMVRSNWTNYKANATDLGMTPVWDNFTLNELMLKPSSMKREVAQGLLDYAEGKIVN